MINWVFLGRFWTKCKRTIHEPFQRFSVKKRPSVDKSWDKMKIGFKPLFMSLSGYFKPK